MQFTTGAYYGPMDRSYYETPEPARELEKPIIPISELGTTVPEKDPASGAGLIQNVEASLRQGAKKLQIALNVSSHQAIGGRPKAYGKEFREDLRELARVNDAQIEGVEMPTSSMSNLSGYDMQQHSINEQKRANDIQEVKDAIRFVADIAGGGGVDIWSQEFTRDIYDAEWNQKGKWKGSFKAYEGEEQYASAYVVDKRTGRVTPIQKGQPIFEPVFKTANKDMRGEDVDGNPVTIRRGDWLTEDGKWIDPKNARHLLLRHPKWDDKKKEFEVASLTWNDIQKKVNDFNSRWNTDMTPEEYAIKTQLDQRWLQTKGQSLFYSRNYADYMKRLKSYKESLAHYLELEKTTPKEELWRIMENDPAMRGEYLHGEKMLPSEIIKTQIDDIMHHLKHVHEASSAADAQAMEVLKQQEEMVSLGRYALQKTVDAYADLGIEAMNETIHNSKVNRPIHVGPELGWPQAFGGHPEEFIKLIKESRKRMAEKLVQQGFSKDEAKQKAKTHLKGVFDTSHMGMWINHFPKQHPQETEEQREKRFKKWYIEMVDKMAKADVIGGVQAVDSATGAHGHLPAGQGFLGHTVVEAVDKLKSHGWNGFIVSEGHEEEAYGRGRILMQTWKAFGADIGVTGFFEAPTDWRGVEGSYFGHTNPPPYMVGPYAPSEDYRGAPFWSGLPLD